MFDSVLPASWSRLSCCDVVCAAQKRSQNIERLDLTAPQ